MIVRAKPLLCKIKKRSWLVWKAEMEGEINLSGQDKRLIIFPRTEVENTAQQSITEEPII